MTSPHPNDPNIQVGEMVFQGPVTGTVIVGNNNSVIHQEAVPTQRRNKSPKPPGKPEGFVGRARELQQVEGWIAQNKAVIIHGVDGIGKTALLKQAANSESAQSQPDGVVFIDAIDEEGKLLEFGDVIQRIFDALFESKPPEKVNLNSAATYLSHTKPLVLVNGIGLIPKNVEQLEDLFSKKAPILIATENSVLSRGPRSSSSLLLGPLDPGDSLSLLSSLASVEDQEALTQIASLLGHVPAALGIVADTMRTDGLSAEDVLQRLQSYTPRDQNKARAALERAFYLLSSVLLEDQREVLDQVAGIFGVSVDRKWLESIYGAGPVHALEDRGLIHANSPRLRLMPGLKPILTEGRDFTKQRERLLNYLLTELKTRWNDFEFIKDELGNLLGLLFWCAAQGQWANVAAIGRAIDPYLTLNGQWDAWRKTLGEVQRAAQALQDLALQGWVLHQLGTYEFGMGNLAGARSALEQAISVRQKIGDEIGVTYSKNNLQVIAPAVAPQAQPKPVAGPGKLISWVLGGLAVLAIGAFLVFNALGADQPPPATEPVVAASEVNVAIEPSATLTPTTLSTLTETSAPSATITATETPSPTETPTASPTYAILTNVVVNELARSPSAYCFHGPGSLYLNKGTGRIPGNEVDLLGRIETNTGIWVHTRFSLPIIDASDPCWMEARFLDITEEQLMAVKPIDPANPEEYRLPLNDRLSAGRILQDPVVTEVDRIGDSVTVKWQFFDVGEGEYPEHDENAYRYLIEAWLCKAGKIVFTPSGWGPYGPNVIDGISVSANLQDEAGCMEPSHARLYLVWAHGYIGPVEIRPWPQNGPVLPTSTPTP